MVFTKVCIIRGVLLNNKFADIDDADIEDSYIHVDNVKANYPKFAVMQPPCCCKLNGRIIFAGVLLKTINRKKSDRFTGEGMCSNCEEFTMCENCLNQMADGTSIDVTKISEEMVEADMKYLKYVDFKEVDKDIRDGGLEGDINNWYVLNDCLSCT